MRRSFCVRTLCLSLKIESWLLMLHALFHQRVTSMLLLDRLSRSNLLWSGLSES